MTASAQDLKLRRRAPESNLTRMLGGEHTRVWLRTPHSSLGDKTPTELLGSEEGLAEVETLLLRFEHGVFG